MINDGLIGGPPFRFSALAGPQPVGIKVVEQYDLSRTYRSSIDKLGRPYSGERSRPLQTLIWYPALSTAAQPMTVRDYVELSATETSFGEPNMPAKTKWQLSYMNSTLPLPLWAVRDAPELPGCFPLVVYAPGFSNPSWENADLCEYLASHGYVVIASASMGETTRAMTHDLAGINAQARDISFLIGAAGELCNVDRLQVAVVGFSWGAISNLFAAARDNRIAALVALDGSLRYSPGLVKLSGDIRPEEMTIPLLSFAQRNFSFEDQARYVSAAEADGPNVLNAWTHGDLIEVHMMGMCHMEFSSMSQRNEDLWWKVARLWPLLKGDYDREDGMSGYAWMGRYVLEFLNAYLRHDSDAESFLNSTPAKNGVPRHIMAVDYRYAKGFPFSLQGFRAELGRRGFDQLAGIYHEIKSRRPDFDLTQETVDSWSDELMDGGHVQEAIALCEFSAQLNPQSSAAYARLGDIYRHYGKGNPAKDHYTRALEIDPFNEDANSGIVSLEAGVLSDAEGSS